MIFMFPTVIFLPGDHPDHASGTVRNSNEDNVMYQHWVQFHQERKKDYKDFEMRVVASFRTLDPD